MPCSYSGRRAPRLPPSSIVTFLDKLTSEQHDTGNSDAIMKFHTVGHNLTPFNRLSAEESDAQIERRNVMPGLEHVLISPHTCYGA